MWFFHRFNEMDLVEQVHFFGLSNIHTYGSNISLISLFSLMLNYAKPRKFMTFMRTATRYFYCENILLACYHIGQIHAVLDISPLKRPGHERYTGW